MLRLISDDGNPSIEKRHAAPPNKHRLNDRFISDLKPKPTPLLGLGHFTIWAGGAGPTQRIKKAERRG